ncbi:hypothetical protein COBT_003049, partial [Conglomerata obtusa]
MNLYDLKYHDKLTSNTSLIQKHLQDIEGIKDQDEQQRELKFEKLRRQHDLDSSVFFYYQNLYKDCFKNQKETLHGYKPLINTRITYNAFSIFGTIFVLSAEEPFRHLEKEIKIHDKIELCNFYNKLLFVPLPFIFIPDCDLYKFNEFMKELYDGKKNFEPLLYVFNGRGYEIVFCEPLTMCYLDLGYLVDEFITDQNINCFLSGFVY